jgi:catechol 2,3-dioxygenase-like lactoylglutathione lyase family enzyme
MATKFQVTFDCAEPARMVRFWCEALGYVAEDPPAGFDNWRSFWLSIGLPEHEATDSSDAIVDPDGVGPRIWFQQVPESKVVKNRLHLDLTVSGGRAVPLEVRKQRVDTEASRLEQAGATKVRVMQQPGLDHYAVAMLDPEGNEFDLN